MMIGPNGTGFKPTEIIVKVSSLAEVEKVLKEIKKIGQGNTKHVKGKKARSPPKKELI